MIFIESYEDVGGGQKTLAKIANLQTKLYPKVKSYLILTASSKIIKDLYNNEIKIIEAEMSSLNKFGNSGEWLKFRSIIKILPSFLFYQIKLFCKLIIIKDKHVFLCDYRALVISILPCLLSRKKIYFYIIGGSPFNNKINKFLSKLVYKNYSISDNLAKELEITNYTLVRNGIDVSKFTEKTDSKTKGLNKFLYVGTLTQNKGVHRLISALKSSNEGNWTLDIIGGFLKNDPYKIYLKNIINGDNRIKMLGFVKEIHLELKKYNTLIFPSVLEDCIIIDQKKVCSKSTEGSPTIIIEAVLSGLKVIANDVTGVQELSLVLPNIFVLKWEDFIKVRKEPNLIEISNSITYQKITPEHRRLFDKSVIYKKLLEEINFY